MILKSTDFFFFDKMPEQRIIPCNSMIITHNQHGFVEDGIKLFVVMLREGIKPAEKLGFGSDISVVNSVISLLLQSMPVLMWQ